jgi:hypothetical protein
VAILGSADFDVTGLVPETLVFGPAAAPLLHDGHLEDANGDGIVDLLAHFDPSETGIGAGDVLACVAGETTDRLPFTGCDRVAVGPGKPQ